MLSSLGGCEQCGLPQDASSIGSVSSMLPTMGMYGNEWASQWHFARTTNSMTARNSEWRQGEQQIPMDDAKPRSAPPEQEKKSMSTSSH